MDLWRPAAEKEPHWLQVLLVGGARSKEITMESVTAAERAKVLEAMQKEWSVYKEFQATEEITQKELDDIMNKNPGKKPKIVDTRWVLTRKGAGFKARLVVIGCQEPRHNIRTESPTGSLLMVYITLTYACQKGWQLLGLDARSAFLQSANIERLLLLRLPRRWPPPGCKPEQVVIARGAIYGTRDAGRSFYKHSRQVLSGLGFAELSLEKACYVYAPGGTVRAVVHTHVDDFLIAWDGSMPMEKILDRIATLLYMKRHPADGFTYRGLAIKILPDRFTVDQRTVAQGLSR
jgi:hypothetical protein